MKKFILLSACVCFMAAAFAQLIQLGTTNTYYELTGTAPNLTLTISGTGNMPDFPSYSSAPWYSSSFNIRSVVIEYGVTSIGNLTFSYFSSLTSVIIPNSVTSIGNYAFMQCTNLTSKPS